jgi:hypothetical protein
MLASIDVPHGDQAERTPATTARTIPDTRTGSVRTANRLRHEQFVLDRIPKERSNLFP